MSRAFVKEPDGGDVFDDMPDRLVSEYPNLVSAEGLTLIEAEVVRLQSENAEAHAADDRAAMVRAARDLRYWSSRLSTAQVQAAPADTSTVQFGSTVTLIRADGRKQTFRIVGEDEADPSKGTLSYVAPLAQALLGKPVGDTAAAGAGQAEILQIS